MFVLRKDNEEDLTHEDDDQQIHHDHLGFHCDHDGDDENQRVSELILANEMCENESEEMNESFLLLPRVGLSLTSLSLSDLSISQSLTRNFNDLVRIIP